MNKGVVIYISCWVNKPDRERQVLFAFSYMWKLKETQDKPIDIENISVMVRDIGCKMCEGHQKVKKEEKKKFRLTRVRKVCN